MGHSEVDRLVAATIWDTGRLVAWTLNWHGVGDLWPRPCWKGIADSAEEARLFCDRWRDDKPEYLRYRVAEALVESGWTLDAINRKKS